MKQSEDRSKWIKAEFDDKDLCTDWQELWFGYDNDLVECKEGVAVIINNQLLIMTLKDTNQLEFRDAIDNRLYDETIKELDEIMLVSNEPNEFDPEYDLYVEKHILWGKREIIYAFWHTEV